MGVHSSQFGCARNEAFLSSVEAKVFLYVRQLAWLRATPDGETKSRLEHLREKKFPVAYPPSDGIEYLINWWEEAGAFKQSAAGIIPLEWGDIESWRNVMVSRRSLEYEQLILMNMSKRYCYQYYVSDKKDSEPPYSVEPSPEEMAEMRRAAEERLRSLF